MTRVNSEQLTVNKLLLPDTKLSTQYSAEDTRDKRQQNQYPHHHTRNECQEANASENPN